VLKQTHVGEKLRKTKAYFKRELSKRRLRISGGFLTKEGREGEKRLRMTLRMSWRT